MRPVLFFCGFTLLLLAASISALSSYSFKALPKWAKRELHTIFEEHVLPNKLSNHFFLERCLGSRAFNQAATELCFDEHLKWRESEGIAGILDENWEYWNENYPYEVVKFDALDSGLSTSLVLSIPLGRWDIAKVATSFQKEQRKFVRYASIKMLEEVNRDVLAAALLEGSEAGSNNTKFSIFVDFEGYNAKKQGCTKCGKLLAEISDNLGTHWREAVNQFVIVNRPRLPCSAHERMVDYEKKYGFVLIQLFSGLIERMGLDQVDQPIGCDVV